MSKTDTGMTTPLEALEELLEVADLRGDSTLPHPADDSVLWTARMQDAWDEARTAIPIAAIHGNAMKLVLAFLDDEVSLEDITRSARELRDQLEASKT